MSKTLKTIHANEQLEDEDLPFNGPTQWYPYRCLACKCKMWVEDIIIDAFPPDGPGKCPIVCCPKCGQDFVRDIKRETIISENDPNLILEQEKNNI
jgi:hypothetical protein